MMHRQILLAALFLGWGLISCGAIAFAATASPSLAKAKADAEAKGYIFEASRDEILAKAKKEGKVRVLSTIEPAALDGRCGMLSRKSIPLSISGPKSLDRSRKTSASFSN